jgi:hypothetical protein
MMVMQVLGLGRPRRFLRAISSRGMPSLEEEIKTETEFENRFFSSWKIAVVLVALVLCCTVGADRLDLSLTLSEFLLGVAAFLVVALLVVAVVAPFFKPIDTRRGRDKEKSGWVVQGEQANRQVVIEQARKSSYNSRVILFPHWNQGLISQRQPTTVFVVLAAKNWRGWSKEGLPWPALLYIPSQTMDPPDVIFVLAGQSNMSGRGEIQEHELEPTELPVFMWSSKDASWRKAREPLHGEVDEEELRSKSGSPSKAPAGKGPGMAFARR